MLLSGASVIRAVLRGASAGGGVAGRGTGCCHCSCDPEWPLCELQYEWIDCFVLFDHPVSTVHKALRMPKRAVFLGPSCWGGIAFLLSTSRLPAIVLFVLML